MRVGKQESARLSAPDMQSGVGVRVTYAHICMSRMESSMITLTVCSPTNRAWVGRSIDTEVIDSPLSLMGMEIDHSNHTSL